MKHRITHTTLALFHETLYNNINSKYQTDVMLRDVEKAFDKVWHTGLQYKLLQIGLHTCFTRTLCNDLSNKTETIQIGNFKGPAFAINSGEPQGGACLSPTLFSFFTHDMPEPLPNTDYIAFAHDITQITAGRCKYKDATRNTQYAIQQINNYENKWKIKTNKNKFQIVPISRIKTSVITINNKILQYTNKGKILGLTFNTRGIIPQIKILRDIANDNLTKMYRFHNLNSQNKQNLYNALVRSALIYSPVFLNIISKSSVIHLQKIQNRVGNFLR